MLSMSLFLTLLLSLHTQHSSGILVGFSYDARGENGRSWSPRKTVSFLEKYNVSPSQFQILVSNPESISDSFSNTSVPINLIVNQFEATNLTSWIKTNLITHLHHLNITSIIVNSSDHLPTLSSIHSALRTFDLDTRVKVSPMFSLSMYKNHINNLERIVDFVRETGSFVTVEAVVDGELRLGDGFIHSAVEKAITACNALRYGNLPIVLNVKCSVVPTGVEVGEFTTKTLNLIDSHPHIRSGISALFVQVELSSQSVSPQISAMDTPGTVTTPSTNPVTIFPTNPTTTPITVPSTIPPAMPITVPATNPVTPITNPTFIPPVLPITNPAMAPPAVPMYPPVTNPANSYPVPQTGTGTLPLIAPPATMPGTVPVSGSPTVSGQTWCVVKPGTLDAALQPAIDYACGIGGADCSGIEPTGSCYNPASLQAHASYAFNSYYRRNPVPTSCDFGGAATIVSVNPSSGTCVYLSSSSASSAGPGFGSTGSGPNVNANSSTGSTVFGSDNPMGSTSNAFSLSAGSIFLSFMCTSIWISGIV